MTNFEAMAFQDSAGTPDRRLAQAVARAVATIVAPLARIRRARRDAEYLRRLDDHLLKDMGIGRCDIEGAVRGQHPLRLPHGG